MKWEKGDALSLSTDAHLQRLINEADAVVHTVGILLESDYKPRSPSSSRSSSQGGSFSEIARGLLKGWKADGGPNPLAPRAPANVKGKGRELTYEMMNTDTGEYSCHMLQLSEADDFLSSQCRICVCQKDSQTASTCNRRQPCAVIRLHLCR